MIRVRCCKDYSGIVRAFEGQILSFDEETWARVQAETDLFVLFDVAAVSVDTSVSETAAAESAVSTDESEIDAHALAGAPPDESQPKKGKK